MFVKIIGSMIILFLIYIYIIGINTTYYSYSQTKEEEEFINRFDSMNNIDFHYSNRHHNSSIQYMDIYDGYGHHRETPVVFPDTVYPKYTFLKKNKIKKFSDSTFNEFMKVYAQKGAVDTLKMRFHVTNYDTIFTYKVESRWHYFWKNTLKPIIDK